MACVRDDCDEVSLCGPIRQAGGTWFGKEKLWHIRYQKPTAVGLSDRIVEQQDR